MAGLALDAEELWGRPAAALGETVGTAASPQEALSAVQLYVHARASAGEPPDPLVSEAVRDLMPWRTPEVTSLSASLYIFETQLRRRCRTAVGLAPKALHRILRFQGFLALAALRIGYADQSHLTRECVRLTGVSPRVFLTETQQACACHGRRPGHAIVQEVPGQMQHRRLPQRVQGRCPLAHARLRPEPFGITHVVGVVVGEHDSP